MGATIRHTILVVDDEPDVVHSVKDLLRLEHTVLGATRASEGLKLLAENEVHVVMTDQRMPEMTGVEFLAKLRGQHPDAIRLLFTGYADMRAVIDAINEGNVYRYITKPWEPDELLTVIREACERYDLILARRRLTEEVQQRNVELQRANAELAKASELKSAFIRVAGHELRTPLTIQLGLARLALRVDPMDVRQRDWLARIERSSQRLSLRVEQLMGLLHTEKFARPLERQPTDVGTLLRAAADDVRPFIELRRQELVVDAPNNLGELSVDRAKIEDCVNQLLLNAIKFTPDGGRIRLSARRTAEGVRVEVADNGAGVSPADIAHLFQPFFTGFEATLHSSGLFEHGTRGLGLGLTVVKTFVELHGGTVSAQSEPGRGATFIIDLPDAHIPGDRSSLSLEQDPPAAPEGPSGEGP